MLSCLFLRGFVMANKFLGFLLFSSILVAENKKEEIAKISEAMGHLIGKNLQSLGLPLDVDALIKGLANANQGKESPLTEEDCIEALSQLQDETLAIAAEKSIESANLFLKEQKVKDGVVSLEEGKLLYEIVKKGTGNAVEPYSKPLIRISCRSLNGESIPQTEEFVELDEAILGLKKGLVGMKEGEIRKLYIHPELGFEKDDSLLIVEVDLIKADATAEAHAASNDLFPNDLLVR